MLIILIKYYIALQIFIKILMYAQQNAQVISLGRYFI